MLRGQKYARGPTRTNVSFVLRSTAITTIITRALTMPPEKKNIPIDALSRKYAWFPSFATYILACLRFFLALQHGSGIMDITEPALAWASTPVENANLGLTLSFCKSFWALQHFLKIGTMTIEVVQCRAGSKKYVYTCYCRLDETKSSFYDGLCLCVTHMYHAAFHYFENEKKNCILYYHYVKTYVFCMLSTDVAAYRSASNKLYIYIYILLRCSLHIAVLILLHYSIYTDKIQYRT